MRQLAAWAVWVVVAVVVLTGCGLPAQPAEPAASAGLTDAEAILRATVRIRIVAPFLDGQGDPVTVEEDGRMVALNAINNGLGTLVDAGGQTYVLTHDHYPELDTRVAHVVITDYTGREFTLPIAEFRSAIRYRNNGMLLLDAPAGLPAGVAAGDGERIEPGSPVRVVHRQPDSGTLSVVAAVVEGWIDYQGIPSFLLRNAAGEVIAPGNSGGGVWHAGRPVGSIHRTIVAARDEAASMSSEGGAAAPSNRGYATRLSPERVAEMY